ncbi:unnamed protein product [Prorocentrum cordatum]|uniref:Uncharacterized protein n=2 Tax=Prorocentrum cordatum TaxID=2364126 RepID=A0ABN9X660_9DINO|nr:unnamed protein product [Polarella glacialis]
MREGHGAECELLGAGAFDPERCAVRVASGRLFTGRAGRCRAPSRAPPEPAFGACALVSSSGALLGSGCGGEIDGHEAVWRMNSPVVAGFQQDVGARTDFNVMMSWPARLVVGPEAPGYEEAAAVSGEVPGSRFPSVPHSSPPRPLDLLNATAVCSGGCGSICGKLMCANASRWNARGFQCANNLFNEVLADFRRTFPSKWSRSTGLRTTFLAGAMCSEVNLYGFRALLPHQPYHYWEPVVQNESSPDVQARKNHHMDFEHALMDRLSRLPAVPLCRTLDPARQHPKV